MIRHPLIAPLAVVQLAFLGAGFGAEERSPVSIAIGPDAGRLASLSIGGKRVPLTEGGGFRAYDATNKEQFGFSNGAIKQAGDKTAFDCKSGDLRLHAEFVPRGETALVTGEIENLRGADRGLLLDYCIPMPGKGAMFSDGLGAPVTIDDSTRQEGNAFPLAVLCTERLGLAAAIPPSEPRIFGIEGSREGLTVRFYLGLSPETANFPNRASFAFIIYGADPKWGFRGALERYYSYYPDCYTPRIKADGFWLKQVPDAVPRNVEQYGIAKVNLDRPTEGMFTPYEKLGILTYGYLLAGVKSLKLSEAPADAVKRYFEHPEEHPDWAEEYANSACKRSNGAYAILPRRDTAADGIEAPGAAAAAESALGADVEGVYALSFIMNPNPDLFQDERLPTVGGQEVKKVERQFASFLELDMAFLDSLGSRWPAILNYRRDHFRYARYPLTVDPNGRVALHNELSHYELVERLREMARARGKFFFANGIYTFICRPDRETKEAKHYRVETKLGRSFMAAMLDAAGSESGVKLDAERARDMRALMGKKYYSVLNYEWKDAAKVEDFLNTCLCYGIFGTNMHRTGSNVHYVGSPDGDQRDKALLDWFIPLARLLHRAGWEPVTYARVQGDRVFLERFGRGSPVYFSLLNESDRTQDCVITFDLQSLGLQPGQFTIKELARGTPVETRGPNTALTKLEPRRTRILALSNN